MIASEVKGVHNRMERDFLLRDVVNRIAGIHSSSSHDLHTLGTLYESMPRAMRDAAGGSVEFNTARPTARFKVAVNGPRLAWGR